MVLVTGVCDSVALKSHWTGFPTFNCTLESPAEVANAPSQSQRLLVNWSVRGLIHWYFLSSSSNLGVQLGWAPDNSYTHPFGTNIQILMPSALYINNTAHPIETTIALGRALVSSLHIRT